MHLIIDHATELTDLQGPMGFWSQQSFEASHKLTKSNYSRSTMHGGGKRTEGLRQMKRASSPAYQMLVKHVRMFITNIRLCLRKTTCCPEGWSSIILAEYGESNMELKHAEATRNKDKVRIKRKLVKLYGRGERLQHQDIGLDPPLTMARPAPVLKRVSTPTFVTPSTSVATVSTSSANVAPCSVQMDVESASNCGSSGVGSRKKGMVSLLSGSFEDAVMLMQESLVAQRAFTTAVNLGIGIGSKREDDDACV